MVGGQSTRVENQDRRSVYCRDKRTERSGQTQENQEERECRMKPWMPEGRGQDDREGRVKQQEDRLVKTG